MRIYLPFLVAILALTSCANPSKPKNILETERFNIHYTDLDKGNIDVVVDSLNANYERIIKSLQSSDMPIVNVHYYKNIEQLKLAVIDVEPNLPDFAIGLAISPSEIHLLSPNHPDLEFQYMIINTIHEFTHCVTLNLNPNFANNPRWLWETIAVHAARNRPQPKNLDYLVSNNPPSLSELSLFTNTYIYEVGYFIGEYLVETFGENVLNELIVNNGNIQETLHMNDEEFTQAWLEFVKIKYEL